MSNDKEIERFLNDPRLVIELCRQVIDHIDAGSEDVAAQEQEAQLREIARSIDRLEKVGVPVPDALRSEKTRLASALSIRAGATQVLSQLAGEFEDILEDLKRRLGQAEPAAGPRESRTKRGRSPKTPKNVLREHIVLALKKHGGRARVADVIEEMGRQLDGKLLPGDLEWRKSTHEYAWQNNAKWERHQMTKDGVLSTDSPHGVWELTEDQR